MGRGLRNSSGTVGYFTVVPRSGTALYCVTRAPPPGGTLMSLKMPEPDPAVLARRAEIVRAPVGHRAGRGRDRDRARDARLRVRRAHRLSPAADGRGAAGDDRAGQPRAALLPRSSGIKVVPRGAGTSLSGGALPLADGVLLGMAQVQPHPRDRLRQPRRRGRAGRHQSRDHAGGRSTRASTTRPTRPRRSPAPSAATSRRIPAACIA